MDTDVYPEWYENTERRIGILEKKVDDMLNPKDGIYPAMSRVESKLKSWAIAILSSIIISIIVELVMFSSIH